MSLYEIIELEYEHIRLLALSGKNAWKQCIYTRQKHLKILFNFVAILFTYEFLQQVMYV